MSLLDTLLVLLMAAWVYMTVWFLIAHAVQRTDLIDSAWGLGFVYVAWIAWLLNGRQFGIKLAAAEFVSLWGLRLFGHIFSRNIRKQEDYRYVLYREKWGKHFWPLAYVRLFLTQGLLLLVISTSTIAIMTANRSAWIWLAIIGFSVWGIGILLEAEADAELSRFIKHKKPGEIMTSGLWRYSRHPNYFGEITAWWGAAIVAISFGQWWGILGASVISFLITKISGIPILEKHYADNKNFQAYARRTSVLIPLPPRKR